MNLTVISLGRGRRPPACSFADRHQHHPRSRGDSVRKRSRRVRVVTECATPAIASIAVATHQAGPARGTAGEIDRTSLMALTDMVMLPWPVTRMTGR